MNTRSLPLGLFTSLHLIVAAQTFRTRTSRRPRPRDRRRSLPKPEDIRQLQYPAADPFCFLHKTRTSDSPSFDSTVSQTITKRKRYHSTLCKLSMYLIFLRILCLTFCLCPLLTLSCFVRDYFKCSHILNCDNSASIKIRNNSKFYNFITLLFSLYIYNIGCVETRIFYFDLC